jgi:hypothetical protein
VEQDRPGPCEEETRHGPVAAGTLADVVDGDFVVELVEVDRAPPVVGVNSWLVEVRDGGGGVVEACAPVVVPWMPDHNHGTTESPVVTDEGAGRYRIEFEPIMGGYWEIRLELDCGDPLGSGDALFRVCVET